ncbi:hypothetical protein ACFQ4K_04365 [Tistrella bauzanensis]
MGRPWLTNESFGVELPLIYHRGLNDLHICYEYRSASVGRAVITAHDNAESWTVEIWYCERVTGLDRPMHKDALAVLHPACDTGVPFVISSVKIDPRYISVHVDHCIRASLEISQIFGWKGG